MTQYEKELNELLSESTVKLCELRAQLTAVTAERDALRRLMPSWSGAPKQAMYLTMDENGRWGWHEVAPSPCSNMWSGATWLGDAHVGAWQTMIFERPTR